MRRGPGEDDQHQQQRFGGQVAGHRHPAEQRRRGAGQAADDDVLRRGALEKAGVEHRVAHQGCQGQPGGQLVGEGQQQGLAGHRQDEGEGQGRRRRDAAVDHRALEGARHDRVDAPVHHVVDRRRRTGAEADAEVAEQQHRPGHPGAGGEEHAHQRGDQHQHHHLGLGQFQVVAPAGAGFAVSLAEQSGHGLYSLVIRLLAVWGHCRRSELCSRTSAARHFASRARFYRNSRAAHPVIHRNQHQQ
ncbi:hypothetical protein D3C80_585530 [compost metagenome]